jgi:sec-independent protein translocase protein TatA
MPIGPLELGIVLIILLVIFGPKRLPGLGRSLGTGMREFKDSISGERKHDDDEDERPALGAAPAPAETTTQPPVQQQPVAATPAEQDDARVSEPRA